MARKLTAQAGSPERFWAFARLRKAPTMKAARRAAFITFCVRIEKLRRSKSLCNDFKGRIAMVMAE